MTLALLNSKGKAVETHAALEIQPMCEKVIARRVDSARKGQIIMPENFEATLLEAKVLRIGPGRLKLQAEHEGDRIPIYLKVGDRVVVSRKAAVEIDPEDRDLLLISEDNVLAFYREGGE